MILVLSKRLPAKNVDLKLAISKLGAGHAANNDWRLKDLTIQIMIKVICEKKQGEIGEDARRWLEGLVRLSLRDSSSFVRASALELMSNLAQDQDFWPEAGSILIGIMTEDTEAIVRQGQIFFHFSFFLDLILPSLCATWQG